MLLFILLILSVVLVVRMFIKALSSSKYDEPYGDLPEVIKEAMYGKKSKYRITIELPFTNKTEQDQQEDPKK
ncbi:MAG: hypothetical protein RBR69_09965 [Candidatus Cloacimonadaceae bacterium]|nr:hypothetical protein [Candidatus Cloacimonadota bacterium]MCK9243382.1 hypothetical protein [Candidatus Cloacimonadota bacterium]MDY0128444.1 hypothetical protein [Candidatus Cloacimonadaceae bacterium]